MCGRYTLTSPNPLQVRARFPVGETVEVRRRFNIAPGDQVLAVTSDRDGNPRGELLRWGLLPSWVKHPQSAAKMINARAETLEERPAYRGAFERFRCLIVADGFYEWQRATDGGRRPFLITRRDGDLFAFAGLWSVWRGEVAAEPVRSCTIITTRPNSAVAPLHDRMPVILEPGTEAAWLDAGTPKPLLRDLLRPLPAEDTALRRVGSAVNDARHDAPDCLADPEPEGPALTLF